LAAEKLKEYRKSGRTIDEATSQGEDVAKIIIEAAQDAALKLQGAIRTTLSKINAVTNEVCSVVQKAALAAEKKI
jgi:hypothetical protein